jgi:outer membrane biosynthesis protein TonB
MPSLETPPNSAPPSQPMKVRTGRYGELEEHELIHLLDTLDDERSKARFRESIYISVIIYLGIVWFLFYGPRVLFHQPRLISPVEVLKERDKQLTFLDSPKNLPRPTPKANTKPIPEKNHARPLDQKTLQQLEAMRKAEPAPAPAPTPVQPAPQQATATPPPPIPPAPVPQPTQPPIVDAPKPAPTRPNFGNPNQSAGDAIRKAAQDAARNRGGDYGSAPSGGGHQGMGEGAEILSDTQGVDFGPYIRRILEDIKRNWYPLIPEEARPPLNKQGETLIRFTINRDGSIAAMNLDGSSQDTAIDRACWGGITGVGQFPPLPAQFKGPNLELRVDFFTNKPIP